MNNIRTKKIGSIQANVRYVSIKVSDSLMNIGHKVV